MAIRVSHAPISAYGRAAYQTGRGEAIQRGQELSLEREKMMMNQEARNRSFAIQEAAGHRAERTMMADAERKGRLDAAGFEQMRAQRQTIEQTIRQYIRTGIQAWRYRYSFRQDPTVSQAAA